MSPFADIAAANDLLRRLREAEDVVRSLSKECKQFGPIEVLHKFWLSQKSILLEESFLRHAWWWGKSERNGVFPFTAGVLHPVICSVGAALWENLGIFSPHTFAVREQWANFFDKYWEQATADFANAYWRKCQSLAAAR